MSFSLWILFLEEWRWMSVLVLAGVEVVSDDKVDENVMVEAKLVVERWWWPRW